MPPGYHAYLLRLWIMDNDGCPQWRLSLEPIDEDALIRFDGPADFLAYLLAVMGRPERPSAGEGPAAEEPG